MAGLFGEHLFAGSCQSPVRPPVAEVGSKVDASKGTCDDVAPPLSLPRRLLMAVVALASDHQFGRVAQGLLFQTSRPEPHASNAVVEQVKAMVRHPEKTDRRH